MAMPVFQHSHWDGQVEYSPMEVGVQMLSPTTPESCHDLPPSPLQGRASREARHPGRGTVGTQAGIRASPVAAVMAHVSGTPGTHRGNYQVWEGVSMVAVPRGCNQGFGSGQVPAGPFSFVPAH